MTKQERLEFRESLALALGWKKGNRAHGDMPWYSPLTKDEPNWKRGYLSLPEWDEDIEKAWRLVAWLWGKGLRVHLLTRWPEHWMVEVVDPDQGITWREIRDTAPLAISLVTLRVAVYINKEKIS